MESAGRVPPELALTLGGGPPAHSFLSCPPPRSAGRPGTVVSVVSGGERYVVDKLARRLGVSIADIEVAGGSVAEVPQREAQRREQRGEERPPRRAAAAERAAR